MASIFTRIVNGEIPCYKVAEDERFFAFLDINPKAEGHTLVIPKMEVDYLFDLPQDIYCGLFCFARKVAKAVEATVPCKRMGVAVLGMEVPHTHIHLVPLQKETDMDVTSPKVEVAPARMQALCEAIVREFANL